MNYWAGSAPWSLGWSLSLLSDPHLLFSCSCFSGPLALLSIFGRRLQPGGSEKSERFPSLSCGQRRHFRHGSICVAVRIRYGHCSPWPHLPLGTLLWSWLRTQMACLLAFFGDTIIPLGPTVLGRILASCSY